MRNCGRLSGDGGEWRVESRGVTCTPCVLRHSLLLFSLLRVTRAGWKTCPTELARSRLMINRRTALQILAATPVVGAIAQCEEERAPRPRTKMGLVIHSFWVRREKPLAPHYPAI